MTRKDIEISAAKRVWSEHCPDAGASVTPAFREWVEGKVIRHKAYVRSHKAWCTCCGQPFTLNPSDASAVCPHCGRGLEVETSRKRTRYDIDYLQEVTAWAGYQVVRTYLCELRCRAGEQHRLFVCHVYDWLISEDGKEYCFSRNIKAFPQYSCHPWSLWVYPDRPEMIFKKRVDCGAYKWHRGWKILAHYPVRRWRPWAFRYGMKGGVLLDIDIYDVLRFIRTTPHFETVWKMRNRELCSFIGYGGGEKWWPQIKIALRAGFQFSDWRMWRDHLELLRSEGFDILNPKYIAPEDLQAAHDWLNGIVEARRERRRRQEEEKRLLREQEKKFALKDRTSKLNVQYRNRFSAVLSVVQVSGDISIAPLQDIRDFFDEGKALHHCVYSNHYYDRDGVLILGARVKGKRTETIELDIRSFRILQCRGAHNQDSPYHEQIYSLMERSIPKFRKAISNSKSVSSC